VVGKVNLLLCATLEAGNVKLHKLKKFRPNLTPAS
jgi:hypothetical protein